MEGFSQRPSPVLLTASSYLLHAHSMSLIKIDFCSSCLSSFCTRLYIHEGRVQHGMFRAVFLSIWPMESTKSTFLGGNWSMIQTAVSNSRPFHFISPESTPGIHFSDFREEIENMEHIDNFIKYLTADRTSQLPSSSWNNFMVIYETSSCCTEMGLCESRNICQNTGFNPAEGQIPS